MMQLLVRYVCYSLYFLPWGHGRFSVWGRDFRVSTIVFSVYFEYVACRKSYRIILLCSISVMHYIRHIEHFVACLSDVVCESI